MPSMQPNHKLKQFNVFEKYMPSYLPPLLALEKLHIEFAPHLDSILTTNLVKLKELSFTCGEYKDFKRLKRFKNSLIKIDVRVMGNNQINVVSLFDVFNELTKLETLSLHSLRVCGGFDAIQPNLTLTAIHLYNQQVKPEGFVELYILSCANLRTLSLVDCNITDPTLHSILLILVDLKYLNISCNDSITKEGLKLLSQHRNIEEIAVHKLIPLNSNTRVVEQDGIVSNCFKGNESLKRISLSNIMLDDMLPLANIPHLTSLRLGGQAISSQAARALLSCPTIVYLCLFDTTVSDDALSCLSRNTTLKVINLCRCRNITPASSKTLFVDNTTIVEMHLTSVEIVSSGISLLKQQIKNERLTRQDIMYSSPRLVSLTTSYIDESDKLSLAKRALKYGIQIVVDGFSYS
ncbi:hypothetical protein AKO1_012684 [Acrasis kona]|uniref:Uncharacterized protein n=1 Tax=Acrasis kona TaxID=1008807 RepID=A0AAW2YW88_9EUKA